MTVGWSEIQKKQSLQSTLRTKATAGHCSDRRIFSGQEVHGASSRFLKSRFEKEHKPIYRERALIMLCPTVFVPLNDLNVKVEKFCFANTNLHHLSFS